MIGSVRTSRGSTVTVPSRSFGRFADGRQARRSLLRPEPGCGGEGEMIAVAVSMAKRLPRPPGRPRRRLRQAKPALLDPR